MALHRAIATGCHKEQCGLTLDSNHPNVLIERRPGLNELQTKRTVTEKARDVKVEVLAFKLVGYLSCLAC